MPSDPAARRSSGPPRVAIIGAAFSANKGAASMLEATIGAIRSARPDATVTVLTTYPDDDADRARALGVDVVPCTPKVLAAVAAPLATLAVLTRPMRVPPRLWARTPAMRAIVNVDVVVDLAGISFVDGRGFPTLVYNSLMTGLPLALGRPTIKASQALGPFDTRSVGMAARLVLPRLDGIVSRGASTRSHLDGAGLTNVTDGADLAFLLSVTDDDRRRADHLLEPAATATIGVVPSQVVANYSTRNDGDYENQMVTVVDGLHAAGHRVVLIPHAVRPGRPAGKMNDLPLTATIAERTEHRPTVIDGDETPGTLREVIGRCDLLVASRFHAMISGLATATPTLVIGWSHKYREVLAQVGQPDTAIDYRGLDATEVLSRCASMLDELDDRHEVIARHLPAVTGSARSGLEPVIGLLTR